MNSIIDLGVYGEDGYTLPADDKSKRSEIPQVQPALNHTTIGALAKTIDKYELIIHPGDLGYGDDWCVTFSRREVVYGGGRSSTVAERRGRLPP